MLVEPYLFFEGRCEEALEFYRSAVGAEVQFLMRYKDSPDPESCGKGTENKVMHCTFKIGESTIMASDGRCQGNPSFAGFAISIAVKRVEEADRLYTALGEGGTVVMPIAQTFWSPRFGMVTDRFGVTWMVNTLQE